MSILNDKIIAAIDIGTNSFHLIIAEIGSNNKFNIIDRMKEVVRLGQGSSDMKYLSEEAMNRGIEVLKKFKSLSDIHKATIRTVATSAVREALNKSEFIRNVKNATDIDIDVISGVEEARLIYLGVIQSLPIYNEKSLIIDIGGGSTEFLLGYKGELIYADSLKIGAIRFTQKYFPNNIMSMDSILECRESIRGNINPILRNLQKEKIDIYAGSSGTILNIASIVRNLNKESISFPLNNYTFSRKELTRAIVLLLSKKTPQERIKTEGLDSSRADIIVAGALILEQIFSELKIKEMVVSDYALREGVVLDSIHKITGIQKIHYISNIRFKSIRNLIENCRIDDKHSKHVANLSLQLFDQLNAIHKLGEEERDFLEFSSLSHDIGYCISHSQHHRHSYYLIRNTELLGFTDREKEIIANVSRYHRKSHPKIKHEGFSKLNYDDQEKVKRIASILRIADGLDRTHLSAISKINVEIKGRTVHLKITYINDKDFSLDIWGAERKKHLFEELFSLKIKFVID